MFFPIPNSVINGDGFYISYNDRDVGSYGDVTTALVRGNMEDFFILNGDHRKAYAELVPQGYDACMDYFRDHKDQINLRSQPAPDPVGGMKP